MRNPWAIVMICAAMAAVVAGLGRECPASTTYAHASISGGAPPATSQGHVQTSASDSDSAIGNCTSQAQTFCGTNPPDGTSWGETTSTVTWNYPTNGGSVATCNPNVTNNSEAPAYTGHVFGNDGTASAWEFNRVLIGAGAVAVCKLTLQDLNFVLSATGFTTDHQSSDILLKVNGSTIWAGQFTLCGDGSSSGTGILAPSNFNISESGGMWMADYKGGDATMDVNLPVGTAFELQLTAGGDGNSLFVSSGNSPQYGITIPTGYAFTPEPATLSLLALGGLAMLSRRRRR